MIQVLTTNVGADNNHVIGRRDTKTGIKANSRIGDPSGIVRERKGAYGCVERASGVAPQGEEPDRGVETTSSEAKKGVLPSAVLPPA